MPFDNPLHLQWRIPNWSRAQSRLLSPPFQACGYTWYAPSDPHCIDLRGSGLGDARFARFSSRSLTYHLGSIHAHQQDSIISSLVCRLVSSYSISVTSSELRGVLSGAHVTRNKLLQGHPRAHCRSSMEAPVSSSYGIAWQAYDFHLLGSHASLLNDEFTGHLCQTGNCCLHCRKLLCFPYGNQSGSSHVSLYLDGNEAEQKLQGIRHTTFKLMIRNQLDPSRSAMKGTALPCFWVLKGHLSSTSRSAPSISGRLQPAQTCGAFCMHSCRSLANSMCLGNADHAGQTVQQQVLLMK